LDAGAKFNANVTYAITLGFELYELDLKYTGYDEVNSKISLNSKFKINLELGIAVPAITSAIGVIFNKGHSISGILIDTPLCWLNIDQI
jgi:hypothetical protein